MTPKRSHGEAFSHTSPGDVFLRPTSPAHGQRERDASPISKLASTAAGANEERSNPPRGERDGLKPAKMRSSIACVRCRKSKIKCLNEGAGTTCRPCELGGRICTYPSPMGNTPVPKRAEPVNGLRNEGEPDVKRVRKRESDAARKQSFKDEGNPLESPPITNKMWTEICAAFVLHFSADLQFLHEGTLFGYVGQGERKPEELDFLLGILTLTARFIPELVEYHSPGGANPRAASEYYANALASRLDAFTLVKPSLERCQALLMLGLYAWGECRGSNGWFWTGCAISMAELLGLFFQEEPENESRSRTPGLPEDIRRDEAKRLGVDHRSRTSSRQLATDDREACVKREIRRRTMYSIFILDRYMSSGRRRRQRIKVQELKVQLPCSDSDFRFGHDVKTGFLYADDEDYAKDEQLDASQGLRIYIRLVDLWSKLCEWAFQGGRRKETLPPWDPRSNFFKLRKQFDDFDTSLPEKLALSPFITENHINTRDLTVYTAIHTLYSLCRVYLHREYVPFIALGCDRPCGPLDAPLLPKDKYDTPPGFWEESAEQMFKAAKDITDIVRITSQRGSLVESPTVAFAIYTAAFIGTYSINFPHMDQKEYMCDQKHSKTFPEDGEHWPGRTGLAVRLLRDMRLQMARGWLDLIKRMFEYFVGIQSDHTKAVANNSSNEDDAAAALKCLRAGGLNGGRREYELVERELAEFGTLDERSTTDNGSELMQGSRANTRGPSMTPQVKTEYLQGLERTPSQATEKGWAAINGAASNNTVGSYPPPTAIHDPAMHEAASVLTQGSYYQHHLRGLGANQPNILNPPTAVSNSSLSSPYSSLTSPYTNGSSAIPQHRPSDGFQVNGNHSQYSSWAPDRSGVLDRDRELATLANYNNISMGGDMVAFAQGMPTDQYGQMDIYSTGYNENIPDFIPVVYNLS